MIITCPHCQTKYQVTYEAIGSAGRKVQCAHCHEAWQQAPVDQFDPPPTQAEQQAFEAIEEDGMDEAMLSEERAVAAELAHRLSLEQREREAAEAQRRFAANNRTDAATQRQRQKDFKRRQSAMVAGLPLARLRRSLRVIGALLLVGVLATAYFGRVDVVKRFPAMAGVYAAIGLGVNVVGLDFDGVNTLRALRDGKDVLSVSAQIVGLMPRPVHVPPVVVTLLDARGQGIYEWSVNPGVSDLMAGERATFDTQLTMPPGEAARVRLSFAGGSEIASEAAAVDESAASHGPDEANPTDSAAPAAPSAHQTSQEHH